MFLSHREVQQQIRRTLENDSMRTHSRDASQHSSSSSSSSSSDSHDVLTNQQDHESWVHDRGKQNTPSTAETAADVYADANMQMNAHTDTVTTAAAAGQIDSTHDLLSDYQARVMQKLRAKYAAEDRDKNFFSKAIGQFAANTGDLFVQRMRLIRHHVSTFLQT